MYVFFGDFFMKDSTFDIRRRFLDYFKGQGHTEVSSSSVIPHDDKTLFFANAGMNQFKDVFLGKSKRSYTRATTSQKCIRAGGKHNDLENVGHTSRHLTFFEMLGNFSFGDYFKKDAIKFAWEVSTQVFGFPEDKIYPTIYKDDDEAFELWKAYVPSSRISRFGEKENFWAMGDVGPCGPCSELLFDRGSEYGSARNPSEDASGERFLEFWNLVFMQYNRQENGSFDPLPRPSIDTGAGLERVISLIQNKNNVFETDVLRGIIQGVERVSGVQYDPSSPLAPAFNVIADHLRSLSFSIADGALPGNADRGYVLRKILRRAVRYGKQLGFDAPFLGKILPDLIGLMGDPYIELKQAQYRIEEVLTLEEEAFFRTLKRGGALLNSITDKAKKLSSRTISGDDAFLLKDTYGLPLEEIQLIAIDNDVSIDTNRFYALEEEAKEKSRSARKTIVQLAEDSCYEAIIKNTGSPCRFLRPSPEDVEAKIIACIKDGKPVASLSEGEVGSIILDITPFYAEMGGQVGDTGVLQCNDVCFSVENTQTPYTGVIAHVGTMEKGSLHVGNVVHAKIDSKRRKEIERNHTATHLLHVALHEILGGHAKQAGSLVCREHLRFDFSHNKALSSEELFAVEERVNELIRENSKVVDYELLLEEVQKRHDIRQFFGEKYGNIVRVLEVGVSKELCGGTHVAETGSIGYFRILKESSIASGVRRIEAVTGKYAVKEARNPDKELEKLACLVKVPTAKLEEKLTKLVGDMKILENDVKTLKREKASCAITSLRQTPDKKIVFGIVPVSQSELVLAVEEASKKYPESVSVLGCADSEKAYLSIKVPSCVHGLHAGNLLKEGLSIIEGNGGGKEVSASGAGKRPEKLEEAICAIVSKIQ